MRAEAACAHRALTVTPYPAPRCEYYSLPRALAQNHVIAWNTLTQSANTRGSSVKALGGFNPYGIAVRGDLEDVEGLGHKCRRSGLSGLVLQVVG